MTSKELRQKYLDFFKDNGHSIIPSAPLIPSDEEQLKGKEKVLFTSAGMQPLIPYLMGKSHPEGKRLADVQKCLRTDDIDEVGDAVHHTFFEMLGNWSLGDYWKNEAIELSFNFLTDELKIPLEKIAVSVFAGDNEAPRDEESANKWKELGIPEKRVAYLGKEANWWPTNPSAFGPCGPDTEVFIWTGEDNAPEEFDPKDSKWIEVWNDVFMEFNRKDDGSLEELSQKNVDTGMGLERMLAVLNGKDNDYETDLFLPIIDIVSKSKNNYSEKSKRIIADHLRAAVFILSEKVKPYSRDKRGSIAFRLIRDSLIRPEGQLEKALMEFIVNKIIDLYSNYYKELKENEAAIISGIYDAEMAIKKGGESEERIEELKNKMEEKKREVMANPPTTISPISLASTYAGQVAFDQHQTWGTTAGTAMNVARDLQLEVPLVEKAYQDAMKKHQEISKPLEKDLFKGGLAGHSESETKYHTATHLLHQALRDVLGPEVFQKGSNINEERLRFDFSYDKKMTPEEIKKVEDIINERIKQDLKVDRNFMSVEEAKKINAIGLFNGKYEKEVSIYQIGPGFTLDPDAKDQRDRGGYYSAEFCGGPHVEHTGVIGKIKITKEEAISAGIRRIYADLI